MRIIRILQADVLRHAVHEDVVSGNSLRREHREVLCLFVRMLDEDLLGKPDDRVRLDGDCVLMDDAVELLDVPVADDRLLESQQAGAVVPYGETLDVGGLAHRASEHLELRPQVDVSGRERRAGEEIRPHMLPCAHHELLLHLDARLRPLRGVVLQRMALVDDDGRVASGAGFHERCEYRTHGRRPAILVAHEQRLVVDDEDLASRLVALLRLRFLVEDVVSVEDALVCPPEERSLLVDLLARLCVDRDDDELRALMLLGARQRERRLPESAVKEQAVRLPVLHLVDYLPLPVVEHVVYSHLEPPPTHRVSWRRNDSGAPLFHCGPNIIRHRIPKVNMRGGFFYGAHAGL